jgi:hypothetical protein
LVCTFTLPKVNQVRILLQLALCKLHVPRQSSTLLMPHVPAPASLPQMLAMHTPTSRQLLPAPTRCAPSAASLLPHFGSAWQHLGAPGCGGAHILKHCSQIPSCDMPEGCHAWQEGISGPLSPVTVSQAHLNHSGWDAGATTHGYMSTWTQQHVPPCNRFAWYHATLAARALSRFQRKCT